MNRKQENIELISKMTHTLTKYILFILNFVHRFIRSFIRLLDVCYYDYYFILLARLII